MRTTWTALWTLIVAALLFVFAGGCAGGSDIGLTPGALDGDADTDEGDAEGETADGDAVDGEEAEGDGAEDESSDDETTDGDAADGDATDGDATDGDATDGDSDGEDSDPEPEPDIEIPADWVFVPDQAAPAEGQIVLANPVIEEDYLILQVRLNGFTPLAGSAFRLRYNPATLSLAAVERGDALSPAALLRAAQAKPGEAWVGIGNPQAATVTITEPKILCQVSFKVIGLTPTRLDFDLNPWHSFAADERLRALPATFFGGSFGPAVEGR
ncbi:MAG: hypothetical protein C4523_14690 [Myxococcales bacterium]|nr:MAG: hypothetical protein C4523_14690 [Myxococcales bacterium]